MQATPPIAVPDTRLWAAVACIAIVLPTLLAFNVPPSATFLNQAAALIGWGAWLAALAASRGAGPLAWSPGLAALTGGLVTLMATAAASPLWAGLPWSLSLSSLALIAAALLAILTGAAMQTAGLARPAFRAFCIALVIAGVCSSAIGIIQVFVPALADGDVIARSVLEGRAVGNLRQPNHLSSLLLWAIVASIWLGEARAARRVVTGAAALLFLFVVVLSASRTGAVGALTLALWGGVDRRLSRPARTLLILMPVIYAAFWLGTSAWADYSHHVFGGETRFSGTGDVSSSRFGIWANTLALIAAHPWLGVGFGEFNFAWSLTPFPGRPGAFFDHTHDLPLQFAVELGLPLAALVMALLLGALYSAFVRAWRVAREPVPMAAAQPETAAPLLPPLLPAAFLMVLMVTVHSLLEYPLWYAYFLLPAGFAFGLCLGAAHRPGMAAGAAAGTRTRPLWLASLLLMAGGAFALYDYARVVVIFAPPEDAPPLITRIEDGQRSVFFAHHAAYAAATTVDHPSTEMAAFDSAPHYLLDARLMQAWAKALNEAGDSDRARYVAQRLKEFRNEQSASFFEACDLPTRPGEARPFQCLAPTRTLGYGDFR